MVLLLSERITMTADNHRDYDISREALGLEGDTPKDDKHIEAVAQGTKVSKSKSKARRVAEIFVGGDLKETAVHVRDDVAIPALKNFLYDSLSEGLQRILWGETRNDRRRNSTHRDYVGYSRRARESRPTQQTTTRYSRVAQGFDDIVLATRTEAESVLSRMYDLIERYNMVTVAEFYSLVGISAEFTDENWGWRDLRSANIQHIRDGFRINLPKPEEL